MEHQHLRIIFVFFSLLAINLGLSAEPSQTNGKFLGAIETEYPDWFRESFLDFNEDVAEAAKEGKRIVILFHQNGCPYCNLLVERNLSQQSIADYLRKHFAVVAINMWGDRDVATIDGQSLTEKQFASALKVQFTPTMVFLDEKGGQVLRLNGYLPPERFMLALQYAHEQPGDGKSKLSFSDFVRQHAPAATQGSLIEEPFFIKGPVDLTKIDRSKPTAIWFEQPQCPDCETLHKKTIAGDEIRRLIKGFNNIQLDMWSNEPIVDFSGKKTSARELARSLNVYYAPTIVFFDQNGKEIIRSEAMFKQFHLTSIFDYVLSGAYQKQPSFQRFLEERADKIRSQSVDVDIWK